MLWKVAAKVSPKASEAETGEDWREGLIADAVNSASGKIFRATVVLRVFILNGIPVGCRPLCRPSELSVHFSWWWIARWWYSWIEHPCYPRYQLVVWENWIARAIWISLELWKFSQSFVTSAVDMLFGAFWLPGAIWLSQKTFWDFRCKAPVSVVSGETLSCQPANRTFDTWPFRGCKSK